MEGNIGYLNVNGIKSKWASISNLIIKFDIICFSETKLESEDFSPSIKGYNLVRCDRQNCSKELGGGLLVFIKACYQYKSFKLNYSPHNLEHLAIKIWNNSKYLHLIFTYNPPYNIISTSEFINFLTPLSFLNNLVIMGDLNTPNPLWGGGSFGQLAGSQFDQCPWFIW